ncbi:hypothetical protein NQ314_019253 [Rhamnusium bicolor]|uniref:Dynein axonemal assembly factor 1 homolog n=1 Tax=Rhamnusium bicolor TaxID=1586634 RepID=A0AAV8WQ00_9CUCU|nr:hypothetical protein NQ314_019253 [Rhamnusium bicolor]
MDYKCQLVAVLLQLKRKKAIRLQSQIKSIDQNGSQQSEKNLLKIAPALPVKDRRSLYVRSHSTLNASSISKLHDSSSLCEPVILRTNSDGSLHVSRLQEEKEAHPDRISLDRRGLTLIPIIEGEPRLRLLSLQHNLVNNLEALNKQMFPSLVFLDIYDNQLEQIQYLDALENLRVLLMGKKQASYSIFINSNSHVHWFDFFNNNSRIKKIEGLENLKKNRGFRSTRVEDISSLAKSSNLKEISIDNNPVSLGGDCVSFLVSYLPQLTKLNTMQITDQVRKAAMAWRRNKEITNATFMDLTSDVSLNYRREEVISNARTNWELLRSQTKFEEQSKEGSIRQSGSLSSIGPNADSSISSLASGSEAVVSSSSSSSRDSESESEEAEKVAEIEGIKIIQQVSFPKSLEVMETQTKSSGTTETASNLSVTTTTSSISVPSNSGSETCSCKSVTRNIRSAVHGKSGTSKEQRNKEDTVMRQKAKQYISGLLEEMTNAMNKLTMLKQEWPTILHGFVQNTLLDYFPQLDMYMKQKISRTEQMIYSIRSELLLNT